MTLLFPKLRRRFLISFESTPYPFARPCPPSFPFPSQIERQEALDALQRAVIDLNARVDNAASRDDAALGGPDKRAKFVSCLGETSGTWCHVGGRPPVGCVFVS